jgi:hypothetical protein
MLITREQINEKYKHYYFMTADKSDHSFIMDKKQYDQKYCQRRLWDSQEESFERYVWEGITYYTWYNCQAETTKIKRHKSEGLEMTRERIENTASC